MHLRDLWFQYTQYRYVFSPYGNAYDCFRSWEALLLGAVPVLHYYPGATGYTQAGLAVATVMRESDVTPASLAMWNVRYPDGPGRPRDYLPRLTRRFWVARAFHGVTRPLSGGNVTRVVLAENQTWAVGWSADWP